MASILIIDDEKSIRNALRDVLEYEGHIITEAEDGIKGLSSVRTTNFDLVLCDIKMPKMSGVEFLEMALDSKPELNIIIISGHGDIETAVDCIKKGAYDYLSKPLDLNRLLVIVRNGLNKQQLVAETKQLKKKINRYSNSKIIGSSEAIKTIHEIISKVSPTDARVLITGPNGSGKELIAKALHNQSKRSKHPFIEVNCAAIPSELIESELFGHEKGAFTSAIKTKKGKFEQANGGTLFLDEIGDMSASAQAKVLRALQENKVMRVGGEKEIKVNVRILAATNKNLKQEISTGKFREDLYHRLSVILIENPSLNEREEDIPELATFFLESACKEMGVTPINITKEALDLLSKKEWTGNIRELKNVMERLVILADNKIEKEDVLKYA